MPEILKPPVGASLLLRLFAGETDFPQIEGDLREEFHQRAIGNAAAARRWYKHEAFRNVWVLARSRRTIRILMVAGLCAVALYWSPWLISLGQYSLGHIVYAIQKRRPQVVIMLPFHVWWAIRSKGAFYSLPQPDFWIYWAFHAVIAMYFGILASRAFTDRVWLLRLAFVGWNLALLAYFPVSPVLYGVCWFLLGSAYCSQRMRRQLAV